MKSSSNNSIHDVRREYGDHVLRAADLDADPIAQFERWFQEARESRILEPNAMTVATVDEAGRPDARVVLLKDVRPEGFVFFSNYDSAKGRQLVANPHAALVFHWDRLERQVRIRGAVERIAAAESDAYFRSRPPRSRIAAAASPQRCSFAAAWNCPSPMPVLAASATNWSSLPPGR